MSYASEVKKELTTLEVHPEHAKAELAAILRMNGNLRINSNKFVLNVHTENASIARRLFSLIKDVYQVKSTVIVRKKMNLKKNNIYVVRLQVKVQEILADLDILDGINFTTGVSKSIKNNPQKIRSYLRGAFLAGGSVNNPEGSRYHLEIYSLYEDHNNDLVTMMNHFDLKASSMPRRNGYICYLKSAEKIGDFLTLIGASNSRFKFEDVLILRDFRNSVNRLQNAEMANINKSVSASVKQIKDIELIDQKYGLENLPAKLQEVAKARLANPEISLRELGEILPSGSIGKSGINHRMRKIQDLANKLGEDNDKK